MAKTGVFLGVLLAGLAGCATEAVLRPGPMAVQPGEHALEADLSQCRASLWQYHLPAMLTPTPPGFVPVLETAGLVRHSILLLDCRGAQGPASVLLAWFPMRNGTTELGYLEGFLSDITTHERFVEGHPLERVGDPAEFSEPFEGSHRAASKGGEIVLSRLGPGLEVAFPIWPVRLTAWTSQIRDGQDCYSSLGAVQLFPTSFEDAASFGGHWLVTANVGPIVQPYNAGTGHATAGQVDNVHLEFQHEAVGDFPLWESRDGECLAR